MAIATSPSSTRWGWTWLANNMGAWRRVPDAKDRPLRVLLMRGFWERMASNKK